MEVVGGGRGGGGGKPLLSGSVGGEGWFPSWRCTGASEVRGALQSWASPGPVHRCPELLGGPLIPSVGLQVPKTNFLASLRDAEYNMITTHREQPTCPKVRNLLIMAPELERCP